MLRLRRSGAGVFCSVILFAGLGRAQQQQGGMGGIAGGVASAPVYDEKKRPITAGGFVDSGPIIFEDITKQAGLAGWRHK
ncbi:MAG: CRTAC1 family protein, partial [Terracidiphilus sp.]